MNPAIPEHDAIMRALGELAERVKKAYATNDADMYLSTLDDHAVVSMPGLPPMRGHGELRALFEGRPPLPPGATFSVEPLELEILGPEWAYAYGIDRLQMPEGGEQTMTFLVLLRRTNNGWKTYREVVSADQ